jgi:hypothetical protein
MLNAIEVYSEKEITNDEAKQIQEFWGISKKNQLTKMKGVTMTKKQNEKPDVLKALKIKVIIQKTINE